jgi:hypothetical protein
MITWPVDWANDMSSEHADVVLIVQLMWQLIGPMTWNPYRMMWH